MAIVGSIFAMLGRFAGRLLNTALGWATILLFGKVDGHKQTLLLVIALGSLVWVATVLGVVFPEVGTFLLTFVPLPEFVDDNMVRLVMLGLAILIPLAIGAAAVFIAEPSSRPSGLGIVGGIVRGFPFTFALAVTILLLAVVSLVRKARSLAKRWEDAHVPVIVKPGGYDRVLQDLQDVLNRAGLRVQPRPAPTALSVAPRLLDAIAGRALGGLVPDRLMLLRARDLEVLVYPSDVAIAGAKGAVATARAAIADELTESPAYLTASAEAQRIEDALREIARQPEGPVVALERVRRLDEELAGLTVPFDEWETVYRERLQVERDLLAAIERAPLSLETGGQEAAREPVGPVGWFVAAAGMALLALDVALLIERRLTTARRRS
jgi:hypothetical protein